MIDLSGKIGIVTGASGGLGQSTTVCLARAGAVVYAISRSESGLEETVGEAHGASGSVIPVVGDVTDESAVEALVARTIAEHGRLDFLVNNAGAQIEHSLLDTSNEDWDRIHDTNAKAPFWLSKYAISAMLRAGNGGSIVNVASVLSHTADPMIPAYTSSKHAVLGLTRSVAVSRDFAKAGIRCNAVCPGDMNTPMVQRYFNAHDDPVAARELVASTYPAERIGDPMEVANVIAFLVSDLSSFVNGASITVDGGLTAQLYTSG